MRGRPSRLDQGESGTSIFQPGEPPTVAVSDDLMHSLKRANLGHGPPAKFGVISEENGLLAHLYGEALDSRLLDDSI